MARRTGRPSEIQPDPFEPSAEICTAAQSLLEDRCITHLTFHNGADEIETFAHTA